MESLTLTGVLKEAAGKFPSRPAISVSGKFDLTHSQLDKLVELAASRLVAAGVKSGDVVALTFPNNVELVVATCYRQCIEGVTWSVCATC